ncbi:hypothetical protein AURDEDRAFT_128730 [Auricularia subglabra TFB-10046 SS5]|nr:hypothetical protein AURDEDRAFT_128730 [Auricularia subglabra TFB-10046 SS5]
MYSRTTISRSDETRFASLSQWHQLAIAITLKDKGSTLSDMPGRDHTITRCSYTQRENNSTDAHGVARYHHHAAIAASNGHNNKQTGTYDSPYALTTPQPGDRRLLLVENGRSFWVTVAAGTNLGPDASEYETWAQAPLSTFPEFVAPADRGWLPRWKPVIAALLGEAFLDAIGTPGCDPTAEKMPNDAVGLASAAPERGVDNDAFALDTAACLRPLAWPLSHPQPDDHLVQLLGYDGRPVWVTVPAHADLGPEAIAHDGWVEVPLRSFPGFYDRNDPAWAQWWAPVIQVLISGIIFEEGELALEPIDNGLTCDTSTMVVDTPGNRNIRVMQAAAPRVEAMDAGWRSPAEADDAAMAQDDHPVDYMTDEESSVQAVPAQPHTTRRRGQTVQNNNTFIHQRQPQATKPAPIPIVRKTTTAAREWTKDQRIEARKKPGSKFPCKYVGCPNGSTSEDGLSRHYERDHGEAKKDEEYAPCLLCGKEIPNEPDQFGRHRQGKGGVAQCRTVVDCEGDYQRIGWRILQQDPHAGPELFKVKQYGTKFRRALEEWWAWEQAVDGTVWRWREHVMKQASSSQG